MLDMTCRRLLSPLVISVGEKRMISQELPSGFAGIASSQTKPAGESNFSIESSVTCKAQNESYRRQSIGDFIGIKAIQA